LSIAPDKKIKAVLFDLGETLVNFGKVRSLSIFGEGARLSYDFLKSKGQPVGNFTYYFWRNLVSLHVCRWLSCISGKDFDALKLLSESGAKKGIKLNDQEWGHFAWLWYEHLSKSSTIEPDIVETLRALKEMGLKLGIVSNTFVHGSSLEKHLEQFGILEFFEVKFYSYQFEFRKPDVRIFIKAADAIGERLPNILFVGDRINKDIKPALMLDMPAVLKEAYTNKGRKVPNGAYTINKLSELPGLIEEINNEVKSHPAAEKK